MQSSLLGWGDERGMTFHQLDYKPLLDWDKHLNLIAFVNGGKIWIHKEKTYEWIFKKYYLVKPYTLYEI